MSDEQSAKYREFINRSMDDIEQGWLQSIEIRAFIDNKSIETSIRAWKIRKAEWEEWEDPNKH